MTRLALWSPAFIAAVFVVLFLAKLPSLLTRVYLDSDAATATVIAETFGHGTVILERYGWFTGLWLELLTKPLPLHRQIWEVAPYFVSLLSAALLAWASWRLAGRWAAAMTATVALATSPFVSYDLVTVNYHTGTWFAVVVLAAYCLWLTRTAELRLVVPSMLLVSIFAGASLASDHLFAFVGIVPFALAGLVLLSVPRMRLVGAGVVGSAVVAVLLAKVTTRAMWAAHVHVFAVPQRFTADTSLLPNFGRMLRHVVQLFNGDYFFRAPLDANSVLSLVCAVIGLAALAAPFTLLLRALRSPERPVSILVYATFWSACVALNCASFVLSSEGTHPGFYFVPVLYAVAATAPLAFAETTRGRLVTSLAIAVVAAASLANLAEGRAQLLLGVPRLPPVASVSDRIVAIARKERALRGYAGYWDASSLTWSEKNAVHVTPVSDCLLNGEIQLCKFRFNLNTNWYQPHQGNSFVLRDRLSTYLGNAPPHALGRPKAIHNLNRIFTLYVYPYDIATRLRTIPP